MEKLTYDTWFQKDVNLDSGEPAKDSQAVLECAYKYYGNDIVYACSFGVEGIVLIDLISKVREDAEVVFLDTELHFKQTYELIDLVKEKFPKLTITILKPDVSLSKQEEIYGGELWKKNPNLCCDIRKIQPLTHILKTKHAWISGLRREQSSTRKFINYINQDHKFKKVKVCPLINWTWKDIWRYIHKHKLPYNPLHDHGYPSIGCEKCTVPAYGIDDLRSGRWVGTNKLECGLHQS